MLRLLSAAALALLTLCGCGQAAAVHAGGCAKYASPSGSDRGPGTREHPYATVGRLDSRLSPGQTGCVLRGTYGDVGSTTRLSNSGTPGRRIEILPAPGQRATIVGYIQIDGSFTMLSGFQIDGSNTRYSARRAGTACPYPVSQGLELNGSGDILQNNNIYQSVAHLRGNGIGIGWNSPPGRPPDGTVVRYNKIHDVGRCDDYDHLIYLASGRHVQIYDNWLWNDAHGWGVQLYPGPSDASVHGNVIDAAGSGFTLEDKRGHAATGNQLFNNVVVNSVGLFNPDQGGAPTPGVLISSAGLSPASAHNEVFANASFNNPGGIADVGSMSAGLLTVPTGSGSTSPLAPNIQADPLFGSPDYRSSHDYQLQQASPAAGWGVWNGTGAFGRTPALRAVAKGTLSAAGSGARLAIAAPGGIRPGDLLLASVVWRGLAAAAQAPPGWNEVAGPAYSSAQGARLTLYYRLVGAGPASSYSFTILGPAQMSGAIAAARGVSPTDPVAASGGEVDPVQMSNHQVAAPSISPASPSSLLVYVGATLGNPGSWSPPRGMSEQLQSSSIAGPSLEVATQPWPQTLATGARVAATASRQDGLADLIALTPSAAPFPPTPPVLESSTTASSGRGRSGSAALTIGAPAGLRPGDLLLATVVTAGGGPDPAAPMGWTEVRGAASHSGDGPRLIAYYRMATALEPRSYSFALPGGGHSAGAISAFAGVNAAHPIAGARARATGTGGRQTTGHATAPAIRPASANTLLVFLGAAAQRSGGWDPPAGMSEQFERAGAAGSLLLATQSWPRALATGTRTASIATHSPTLAAMIALDGVS